MVAQAFHQALQGRLSQERAVAVAPHMQEALLGKALLAAVMGRQVVPLAVLHPQTQALAVVVLLA